VFPVISFKGFDMGVDWKGQPDVYFRKVIRKDNDEVSLDADMIRLLVAIDENKSLIQISEEVDMNNTTFKRALSKLLEQGLIEPAPKNIPLLDQSFVQMLKVNLSKAIGPMAEIIIEDAAAEMALDPASIPVHQAAELIAHLALEVPDEESQIEFKKSMLAILNKVRN
jgi:hypothetical protein